MAFTDFLLALLLAAVPLYVAATFALRRRHTQLEEPATGKVIKKNRGSDWFGALLGVLWLGAVYAAFIEPRLLTVHEQAVTIGGTGHVLRVALVSDTHMGQFRHGDWMAKVVDQVNGLHPDAVLLAGDIVSVPGGIGALAPLRGLKAPLGAYAVLGNWDYRAGAVEVRRGIESQGVEVLTNESAILSVDGAPLQLVGLDDATYGQPDIVGALGRDEKGGELPPQPEGTPVVVLAHNPDAVRDAEVAGAKLTLAGHTHGGQVRLPFIGAVPHLPTTIGQRYDKGLFDVGMTQMFITSGVGESTARVRLFDRPEVALLTITY